MNYRLTLIAMLLLIISCTEAPVPPVDQAAVEKEVREQSDVVVQALNDANIDALKSVFWQSDSSVFVIDGMHVRGYDQISSVMEGIPDRRKDIDLQVDDDHVLILSDDMAVHTVMFSEQITQLNDSITSGQGIWTSVHKKIGDEWKVVLVHESHAAE